MEVKTAAAATEQTTTYTQSKPLAQRINDYLAATRTSIARQSSRRSSESRRGA